MRLSPLRLGLVLLLAPACTGASVSYGPRPLPPMAATPVEQCVLDNRIEGGTASSTIVWRDGDWSNRRTMSGIAFYQHGARLTPSRVLHILDDRALESSYHQRRGALGSGIGWAKFRYKGGIWLMGIGLVVSIGSLFADFNVPMAVGGLGTELVGGLMLATSYNRVGDMKTYDAYGKFIFEQDMATRAASAADRYNAGVAARCVEGAGR